MGILDKFKRISIAKYGLKNNYFMEQKFKFLSSDYDKTVNIDLYTVAFNNAEVIEYQIIFMKKFLSGNYRFIVCDNSSDKTKSREIRDVCVQYDISYYRILQQIPLNDPSFSHGMALNWIYYNLVMTRKNDFGFIDHDIFPIKETNIEEYLKDTDLFGVVHYREGGNLWYLWPGFCFYKFDFMFTKNVDFLPCRRCDTGGSNYHTIYHCLNKETIKKANKEIVKVFNAKEGDFENLAEKCNLEYIDENWMHSGCASNWVDNDNKNEKVYALLNQYIDNPPTVSRKQYKTLPIYIVSYNRLQYLKQLINSLENMGYNNIHIIDNASTYPPLLDYLKASKHTVYWMDKNYGHMVFWKRKDLFENVIKYKYYVLTDPDIIPVDDCPEDFLETFYNLLQEYPNANKIGFSLKIDDIPDEYKYKKQVIKWEKKFWKKEVKGSKFKLYNSDIDTTFALYRPEIDMESKDFYKAIRVGTPFESRHLTWYEDENVPDEETIFYKNSMDKSVATWSGDWIKEISKNNVQKGNENYFNKNIKKDFQYYIDLIRGKNPNIRLKKFYKFCKDNNIDLKQNNNVTPSDKAVEIIIPCIDKDATILPLVIESARKNILHPILSIKIISPSSSSIIKKICKDLGCEFIDEESVLPFKSNVICSGWIYQQFLKMAWCRFAEANYYLVLDADTILIQPISFEHDGKMLLEYSDEFHKAYYRLLKKMDIYVNSHVSFIAHHMLIDKMIMKELLLKLEGGQNIKWYDVILELRKNIPHSNLSEYELFANFLLKNYPEKVILEYWYNKSLDFKNLDEINDLVAANKNEYKSLSFHYYNYKK